MLLPSHFYPAQGFFLLTGQLKIRFGSSFSEKKPSYSNNNAVCIKNTHLSMVPSEEGYVSITTAQCCVCVVKKRGKLI